MAINNNPRKPAGDKPLVNRKEIDGADFCEPEPNNVTVTLRRAAVPATDDLALWVVIRKSTEAINFKSYAAFIENALCGVDEKKSSRQKTWNTTEMISERIQQRRWRPFNDSDAYRFLKVATEAFLVVNGGVDTTADDFEFDGDDARDLNLSLGGACYSREDLELWWDRYRGMTNGGQNDLLPYLALIQDRIGENSFRRFFKVGNELDADARARYLNILGRKLHSPFFFELIWSYWQEEGMLVQTVNAIARRFQNIRNPRGGIDPLANMEIGSLFPLSNLLWGYVQDEPNRLSVVRRAYEYDHHYGLSLNGHAVPRLRSADSRSTFMDAFHHLLHLCGAFFKQDDDTTVNADAFPLLNALQEVHLILSQGAHNQFGDLPSTARQEMLFQQWMLSQPELGEFLPTRSAIAYPEPWMGRVEAMRTLQGWGTTSVVNYHNLATFGEQLLLSIRYGAWSEVNRPAQAANWARIWRAEIQGYTHAYRAVSGADITSNAGAAPVNGSMPGTAYFRRGRQMRSLP